MFRTLIYPSSGAWDCVIELPHRSSCSQFVVCWRFGVDGVEWCSFCRLKHFTTQHKPHQISNTQRTENKTADVVIQQHSRKLLKMDILMSETCWTHKKWNKIASDIKLVFHSSTITMMHGPINIRYWILTKLVEYSNNPLPLKAQQLLYITLGIFWTDFVYIFHTILTINSDYFLQ